LSEVYGAIFPLPKHLVERFFDSGKNIFVKYLTHASTKLCKGNIIIFYESRGLKHLVGEGRIMKIEFLTMDDVLRKYPRNLFLDKEELYEYAGDRKSKMMLTITLVKIKKYKKPTSYKDRISMVGKYITKEEYTSILKSTYAST